MAVFVAGYVAIWTAFSLLASLMQWGLLEARLVSPMMVAASPVRLGFVTHILHDQPCRRATPKEFARRPAQKSKMA